MTSETTPNVWVGCLGCYNGGALVGEWFDATDAPQEIDDFNNRFGPVGRLPRDHFAEAHEELWVFDHENFHGLLTAECSPTEAASIAEALERVSDLDAFEAWGEAGEYDTAEQAVSAFEDAAYAVGESGQDAAYDFLDDTGAFEGLPDFWDRYRWHLAEVWLSDMTNGGAAREVYRNGTTYLFFQ